MRFQLKGHGNPIPAEALPDANAGGAQPPFVLNLADGAIFIPDGYIALGFTHYEVWCIGAAGGRGGPAAGRAGIGADGSGPSEYLGASWPSYMVGSIQHWHDPFLPSEAVLEDSGGVGAGGGGGLHVVSGLLVDLPDACPVVVGQAGADAPIGQNASPDPMEAVPPFFNPENQVYDEPHELFYPPVAGGDGGASSFGGDICQASGGKGGRPSQVWVDDTLWIDGQGGEGGSGGQSAAGGGGAGSDTEDPGQEGTWDGTIGKGGGGGRGGLYRPPPIGPGSGGP